MLQTSNIIAMYNKAFGKNAQYKSQKNVEAAERVVQYYDNIWDVYENLRELHALNPDMTCDDALNHIAEVAANKARIQQEEQPKTEPATTTTAKTEAPKPVAKNDTFAQGVDLLSKVMIETLSKMKMDDLNGALMQSMKKELDAYILQQYGPVQKKIEVEVNGERHEVKGVLHEKFDEVLKFVACNEPVYLAGPAGTGKNFLCQQVAECLGLDFYFTNAVTQEYQLKGFTDAMGKYQETQFYKAFTKGGLFMLDELDASIPEVLIILNAAIANRYFDFPAPVGRVEASPNFRIIAAGNTYGQGADYEYVGRSQLDAASLDRFGVIEINYDSRIEEAMAGGDSDLLKFCRDFRAGAKESGIRVVVSYRAISRMAKLSKMLEPEELVKTCLTKSLEKQDLRILKDKCGGCGKYSTALNKLANA